MPPLARLAVALAVVLPALGCSDPPIDLTTGLQVDIVASGWEDAGVVEGKNKVVPVVHFTLTNLSDQHLSGVQMMGSFFRVTDTSSEWGNALLQVKRGEGLAPGEKTPTLTIRSPLGYTGTDPRADMLQNSYFVDATVKLIAKYGTVQWTHVREVPIDRQLVSQ